jgi:putative membrane protein
VRRPVVAAWNARLHQFRELLGSVSIGSVLTLPKTFLARHRLHILIVLFVAASVAGAFAPVNRSEWWEGNIPIVALLVVLVGSYRWWPLSDLSYLLLAIFLVLATIGSHYTYEKNPAGVWMSMLFHDSRNHYDRLVHFSVGLLIYYPVYENLPRIARCRAPWSYFLPLAILLSASALWEIAEVFYGIGMHANPGYTGTDDAFDSQHDIASTLVGAIGAMFLTAVIHRIPQRRTKRSTGH